MHLRRATARGGRVRSAELRRGGVRGFTAASAARLAKSAPAVELPPLCPDRNVNAAVH